jgi:hypothetical protein
MTGEPCSRSGRAPIQSTVLTANTQCPNPPAEIVAVQREIGHCLVNPPVFARTVLPPRLPCIAAAVRCVSALQERRVHAPTDLGSLQRRLQAALGPEDLSLLHVHDAAVPAVLLHCRVVQPMSRRRCGAIRGRPGRTDACTTGTPKVYSMAVAYAGASSEVINSGSSPPSRCFTSVTMASAFLDRARPGNHGQA